MTLRACTGPTTTAGSSLGLAAAVRSLNPRRAADQAGKCIRATVTRVLDLWVFARCTVCGTGKVSGLNYTPVHTCVLLIEKTISHGCVQFSMLGPAQVCTGSKRQGRAL